jgi:membrane protease YdiL (CAAX protease family)
MKRIISNIIFLLTVLLTFSLFFLKGNIVFILPLVQILLTVITSIIDTRGLRDVFFWPLFTLSLLFLPWPLQFLAPLSVYLAVYFFVLAKDKDREKWLKAGTLSKTVIILMSIVIITSSSALLLWYFIADPDISDLQNSFPKSGLFMLIIYGILFSVFNSIWEEFIIKGILWDGLERLTLNFIVLNTIQAVLFGVLHKNGFPRGLTGAILAGVYGFLIGIIRRKSKGLLAPCITHAFADATIFVILGLSL